MSKWNHDTTRRRYDRLARFYDYLEFPMEALRFSQWRARLAERIWGERALEVGVGTGKNMPHYPPGVEVTAIDISPRMLDLARKRASTLGTHVQLLEMDVQSLAFADQTFDVIFGAFVFCSVDDSVRGLRELLRVCKPAGRLILLEHMRPGNRVLGAAFDLLNPLVVRAVGANINRRTIDNLRRTGWHITVEEHLYSDIVRWIEAIPQSAQTRC